MLVKFEFLFSFKSEILILKFIISFLVLSTSISSTFPLYPLASKELSIVDIKFDL